MFGEWVTSKLIKKINGNVFCYPDMPQLPENVDNIDWYIHIPFCKGKCAYCPFRSFPYKNEKVKEYVLAVKKEILIYKALLNINYIGNIYFGGGTPSLCPGAVIEIIEFMKSNFNINGEIGMEANPIEVSDKKICDIFQKGGVSKVSIGVQTFDKELLAKVNRQFKADSAYEAICILLDKGFYISIDMIHGLPDQTVSGIENDLKTLKGLEPHQISYYPLVLFPTTKIYNDVKQKKTVVPDVKEQKKMFNVICKYLIGNGYNQEAFCNFKHDKLGTKDYQTCENEETIGIGVSSFSKIPNNGLAYINTYDFNEYISAVEKGKLPIAAGFAVSENGTEKIKNSMQLLYAWQHIVHGANINISKQRYGAFPKESDARKIKRFIELLKIFRIIEQKSDKYEYTNLGHYLGMRIFRKMMAGGGGPTAEKYISAMMNNPWPLMDDSFRA